MRVVNQWLHEVHVGYVYICFVIVNFRQHFNMAINASSWSKRCVKQHWLETDWGYLSCVIIRISLLSSLVPCVLSWPFSVWLTKSSVHEDVTKWKHFPRYWPFVRGIHWSPVNSPHKGQRRRALMFSLISAWINGWVNNRQTGDLRRHRAHYDVIVMEC